MCVTNICICVTNICVCVCVLYRLADGKVDFSGFCKNYLMNECAYETCIWKHIVPSWYECPNCHYMMDKSSLKQPHSHAACPYPCVHWVRGKCNFTADTCFKPHEKHAAFEAVVRKAVTTTVVRRDHHHQHHHKSTHGGGGKKYHAHKYHAH